MFVRLTLLLAFAVFLCSSATAAIDRSGARVEMGGIQQARYDREGRLAAVIGAEQAKVDDDGMLIMQNVTVTVYTGDGEEVEIRASRGKSNAEGKGDAIFEGEIELISSDYVATTSRAMWRESDSTVRGSDGIVLEANGSKIVGSGFVVFVAEDKMVIYEPRGTIRLGNARWGSKSGMVEDNRTVSREDTGEPLGSRSDG